MVFVGVKGQRFEAVPCFLHIYSLPETIIIIIIIIIISRDLRSFDCINKLGSGVLPRWPGEQIVNKQAHMVGTCGRGRSEVSWKTT